ncbi:MAG: hypothetical protein ACOCUH_00910 [Bacteriovoracia bacterium]
MMNGNFIFIYPIGKTIQKFQDELSETNSEQIFESDSVAEASQIFATLDDCFLFFSDIKKCAKFLTSNARQIKKQESKIYLSTNKKLNDKAIDKLHKLGLTELLDSGLSLKGLQHKIKIASQAMAKKNKPQLNDNTSYKVQSLVKSAPEDNSKPRVEKLMTSKKNNKWHEQEDKKSSDNVLDYNENIQPKNKSISLDIEEDKPQKKKPIQLKIEDNEDKKKSDLDFNEEKKQKRKNIELEFEEASEQVKDTLEETSNKKVQKNKTNLEFEEDNQNQENDSNSTTSEQKHVKDKSSLDIYDDNTSPPDKAAIETDFTKKKVTKTQLEVIDESEKLEKLKTSNAPKKKVVKKLTDLEVITNDEAKPKKIVSAPAKKVNHQKPQDTKAKNSNVENILEFSNDSSAKKELPKKKKKPAPPDIPGEIGCLEVLIEVANYSYANTPKPAFQLVEQYLYSIYQTHCLFWLNQDGQLRPWWNGDKQAITPQDIKLPQWQENKYYYPFFHLERELGMVVIEFPLQKNKDSVEENIISEIEAIVETLRGFYLAEHFPFEKLKNVHCDTKISLWGKVKSWFRRKVAS